MSTLEENLRKDFPEATEAECRRFVEACRDGKRDDDAVKDAAETMIEDYLDWRSLYGLDFSEETQPQSDQEKFLLFSVYLEIIQLFVENGRSSFSGGHPPSPSNTYGNF